MNLTKYRHFATTYFPVAGALTTYKNIWKWGSDLNWVMQNRGASSKAGLLTPRSTRSGEFWGYNSRAAFGIQYNLTYKLPFDVAPSIVVPPGTQLSILTFFHIMRQPLSPCLPLVDCEIPSNRIFNKTACKWKPELLH